jgi:hypothetical protein
LPSASGLEDKPYFLPKGGPLSVFLELEPRCFHHIIIGAK